MLLLFFFSFFACEWIEKQTNYPLKPNGIKAISKMYGIHRNLPLNGRCKPWVLYIGYNETVAVQRRVCTFISRVRYMAPYSFHYVYIIIHSLKFALRLFAYALAAFHFVAAINFSYHWRIFRFLCTYCALFVCFSPFLSIFLLFLRLMVVVLLSFWYSTFRIKGN